MIVHMTEKASWVHQQGWKAQHCYLGCQVTNWEQNIRLAITEMKLAQVVEHYLYEDIECQVALIGGLKSW